MKILQIINSEKRGGGAERFVLDLSISLHKCHQASVDVLSIKTPDNNDFVDCLKDNGINHFVLSNNSIYSPINIIKLYNFIKNGKYDVIHVHLFPSLYYASMVKYLINSKIKLVYTEHNTSNRRRGKKIFKFIDRFIYRKYNRIVAISNQVKENLESHISYNKHNNKLVVINNGINLKEISNASKIDLYKELSIPKDSVIISMISRMTPVKDYLTLIKALEELPNNYHALFIGDGPLRDLVTKQVQESKAGNRIHILGLRNDVYNIYKSSDIIVLSSKYEGFSIAMLEAMASGKPFIASSVEGIKDLVQDVAELFEYQDFKQLAIIINSLSNNKPYYNTISQKCKNFANLYDINITSRKYLDIYES